ncbi:MAG: hypothetical protein AB2A00_37940, partial [Myxococcota bacterium]
MTLPSLLLLLLTAQSPDAHGQEARCSAPSVQRISDDTQPQPPPADTPPVTVDADVQARGEGGGVLRWLLHGVRPTALALASGAAALGVATAWGVTAGASAGALVVLSTFFPTRLQDRYFGPSLALLGGLGALAGLVLSVPLGLVAALLVDGIVWLALTSRL